LESDQPNGDEAKHFHAHGTYQLLHARWCETPKSELRPRNLLELADHTIAGQTNFRKKFKEGLVGCAVYTVAGTKRSKAALAITKLCSVQQHR